MMTHETRRKPRFRVGLRTLFALTVLGPVALVGVTVMWIGGRAVERVVQDRLEEDVELVARAVQIPMSRALTEGRAEQLYQSLESAFRIRRVYGAAVYDANGTLVAQVGAPGGASSPAPEVGRVAEEGRGGEYGRVGERRVYSYFVPLTSPGGRIEGLLQVTRRRSDIEEAVGRVQWQVAVVFGALWLLMAGLVLLMWERGVGRYFHRLSAAMGGVERGARDARVAEEGPREVAEIAASFNRMVAGVERAEGKVREQRRRETALQERLRHSEKLAAIGRLAAGVAHELGTPLAVVDGMAQRMVRRGEEEGEAIRKAVSRMGGIVRQLLEFGARESGDWKRVSARSLLVGAVGAVRGEAESVGVGVELSEDGTELSIEGDQLRLESALVHLLRNAAQAAGSGGTIRARAEGGEEAVRFVVEDSGSGVPEEVRSRLFEPFYTTKPAGVGAGLGLAVVHAVAEEHGGGVSVDGSSLGGARFALTIPREADHA